MSAVNFVCLFSFKGMGRWELWVEEIKDAPPIGKVSLERMWLML